MTKNKTHKDPATVNIEQKVRQATVRARLKVKQAKKVIERIEKEADQKWIELCVFYTHRERKCLSQHLAPVSAQAALV